MNGVLIIRAPTVVTCVCVRAIPEVSPRQNVTKYQMWVMTWDIEMRGNATTPHLDSFNNFISTLAMKNTGNPTYLESNLSHAHHLTPINLSRHIQDCQVFPTAVSVSVWREAPVKFLVIMLLLYCVVMCVSCWVMWGMYSTYMVTSRYDTETGRQTDRLL